MLTVHHLNNSRSQRILWLLEELEVDYKIEKYQRNPKTMLAPDELYEVHPLGKSPVITHDGHTVAESGAIIEYILDAFDEGQLRPERDSAEFLEYRYWLHYAEGSAMTWFLLYLVFDRLPEEAPWLARPLVGAIARQVKGEFVNPRIKEHMDFWEETLAERDYFAGEAFTAADIQMSFVLQASLVRGGSKASYPHIAALVDTLEARPAYQRAIERGGEFSLGT
ncbi:MAG: glutathione S-transferase family protein [Myxococcota bacterium]